MLLRPKAEAVKTGAMIVLAAGLGLRLVRTVWAVTLAPVNPVPHLVDTTLGLPWDRLAPEGKIGVAG